ncbi:ABC transporter permease subunit [Agromyces intestinalis]|uniref:Transport permease protein n=1 Tax=Agromyces intestinalis TaxID=2592652 RepID=A0A5C1YEX4_9MICO|nr:ABC transporter permease [Agromyces intestinalis]QEO13332.1 ABC transporter permease subunit [Agromyces intestinalis]
MTAAATTTTAPAPDRVSLDRRVPPFGGFNLTFLGIELKRKLRNRRTLLFTIVFPVAMYLLIGYPLRDESIGDVPVAQGGVSVAAYIMVSMAVYGTIISATAAGSAVSVERAQGWTRQLRLTPLNPLAGVATKVIAGMLLGLLAIVATFIAGAATGIRLAPEQWILSGIAAWLLGAAVFTTLGLLVGYLVPGENTAQVTNLVVVFLSFIGGLFYPIDSMAPVLQQVAAFTPVSGIGQIARAPITGTDLDWLWLANAIAWLAIFVAGTVWAFRRDTKRG